MKIAIATLVLVWVSFVVFGADSGTAAWAAFSISATVWLFRKLRKRSKPTSAPARSSGKKTSQTTGRKSAPLDLVLRNLLDRRDVLIIDVETTGLNENAIVVEAAVCDTTGAQRFHSYFMLPKGARFTRGASRVNGLTRERLKELNASDFARKWPELKALLEGANTVLAWNAEFDARMLNQTTAKHGLESDNSRFTGLLGAFRQGMPGGRHRLADIAELLRVRTKDEHTARGDIATTLAVMRMASTKEGAAMPAKLEPETERQSAYIDGLCDELEIDRFEAEWEILDGEHVSSKDDASKVITRLKSWQNADYSGRTPRAVRKLRGY